MAELVAIDSIEPSAYNPRNTDPDRLRLIELSLSKIGWLFPIYATANGEVLSGHQRHLVAGMMGLEQVPVEHVAELPLDVRKAVNILFNRATNEMRASTTTADLRTELGEPDLEAIAKRPDAPDPFPCLSATERSVAELVGTLGSERNEYGTATSRLLDKQAGVRMPVIVSEGRVLNGVGRLRHYQRVGLETCPVVDVGRDVAELAALLVNKVTMDFDINERYADLLRYNSFRRTYHKRPRMGLGFMNELGRGSTKTFDIYERRDRNQWISAYGRRVVDFGAGLLVETRMLRDAGVEVSPFEPYVSSTESGDVDTELSRKVNREFLADVAAGKRWDSVFCSSVLNSVPFDADRQHVAAILAALCTEETTLHLHARSDENELWKHVAGKEYNNKVIGQAARFALDYEPGITLGSFFDGKPKVQKHFTPEEFVTLFGSYFDDFRARRGRSGTTVGRGRRPRGVKVARLNEALDFEFDLPMPDGQRLGLAREARDAFKARRAALR